jgi:hypothetical protein
MIETAGLDTRIMQPLHYHQQYRLTQAELQLAGSIYVMDCI